MNFDILINEYYASPNEQSTNPSSKKSFKKLLKFIVEFFKSIAETFKNLPLGEAILLGTLLVSTFALLGTSPFWFFKRDKASLIILFIDLGVILISAIILAIIDNSPQMVSKRLELRKTNYKGSLDKLAKFLQVKYQIDKNDIDTLELLLNEAEINKEKYNYVNKIKNFVMKPSSILSSIISFLIGIITSIEGNVTSIYNELPTIFIIIILFTFFYLVITNVVFPEISRYINKKYYFHEEFIEEIRQLIITASIEKYEIEKNKKETNNGGTA